MFLLGFAILLNMALPSLTGRVVDASRRPVSHAEVRVTTADGRVYESTTNDRGVFRFEVSGRFQIEISHPGFRSIQSNLITLRDGDYQTEINLLPGDSETMDPVDLKTQEQQTAEDRADPNAREALPKSDRLFGLRGGVNVTKIGEGSTQQWLATKGNVFTSSSTATTVTANTDFSADLGDSTTADDALPTGEDVFHGNLHHFMRNDALNARNYFDPPNAPIPPFEYNFFGGDAGGKVRNGTYLYAQYWGLRIGQSITRTAVVPHPAWLEGNFSDVPQQLIDPDTGFPFPGNQIPKERFNATGLSLARLYPAPNAPDLPVQNYRGVAKLTTAADSFGFRVDHRVSVSDEAFIEYQFSRDTTDDPFNLLSGITNLPFYGVRDALQTHSIRINNSHVFATGLIQETRFSFAYLKQPRTILSQTALPAVMFTGLSSLGHAPNLPQERRNRSIEVLNNWMWQHKNSSTKAGVEFRYFPLHASMDLYSRGQFQFTSAVFTGQQFANLLLGYPTNALRIDGNSARDFRTWTLSFYAQHERIVRNGLSVNWGVRYDYQSPFTEDHGLAANFDPSTDTMVRLGQGEFRHDLYQPDLNNWAPRLGLTWQPANNTVFRAGYGIFYDTLSAGDSLFLLGLNPPFVKFDLHNNPPNVPIFTIDTAFASRLETPHPSVFSTSSQVPNPYVQQWNLSLERALPWDLVLDLGYYGQKGTRLRRQVNINQPAPGPLDTLEERRPFANFGNIFQFETSASSIGHAAEVRINRRFRNSIAFDVDYRFSRLIDDATLISVLPQDSHNLHAERGLADFQMKHRLTFDFAASLPSVRWVKGWQLHGVGVRQSGTPLSAFLDADVAGTGSPIVNRPDLVHNPNIDNPTPSPFFDKTAFQTPAPGHFGNSGRNVIIGPGTWNLDLALSRILRLSDAMKLQFRGDAYNVLNHPNFIAPPSIQNFADQPDFGAVLVARSPRILQFGLKFLW